MVIPTFVESLSSSLDVRSIDNFFLTQRKTTEKILKQLRPEGMVDGNRFKLGSIQGGAGKSADFNFQNGQWGDWSKANAEGGQGIVSFVCATMSCSQAQAVNWLVDEKFLDKKSVKKSLAEAEGDPLVFPIPQEAQPWEYVQGLQILKKDRGLIKHHWTYYDTDGTLLGYKYRIDDRRTSKEVFTLTYRAESQWAKKAWDKKHVPPYGLEQIGEGPNVRFLFVEGEKAADKAKEVVGNRWKVLSFSGVTGANSLWLPDGDFWEGCEVVIWPDNDSPGKESARKLQLLLQSLKHQPREIRIVRAGEITGLPPKWDIGDWEEDCGVDVEAEIERAQEVKTFEYLAQDWVYVMQTDLFYNLRDRGNIVSAAAFDRFYTEYSERNATPSKKFLQDTSNKKVTGLDFVPGEATILEGGGMLYLNEWYDTPEYAEAKRIAADETITNEEIAGKAKFFIEHLQRICGDEISEPDYDTNKEPVPGTENRTVLDALTWHFSEIVKRPMDKRGWIPMLVSEENGTGKTYFRYVIQSVLGSKRASTITVSQFTSEYQDWAEGLLFYELGEAKSHETTEVYEELKKRHNYTPWKKEFLTDRDKGTQRLNIKSKAMRLQRDFCQGYISSNDLFPLALANGSGEEGSDRRLLVINPRTILSETEATNLFDELNLCAEWIGAYLLRYKAKFKWNPSWAPITAHKRLMLEKDRARSETRSDKTELGRYDDFYHFLKFSREEKIGAFKREVISRELIQAVCDANRIKFPYDTKKFEALVQKAGLTKGPSVKIDGISRPLFSFSKDWLQKPSKEWAEELKSSINDAKDRM